MVLNIWSRITIIYLASWTIKLFKLIFNKPQQDKIKIHNDKLKKLRDIPVKTMEEQKMFLDMQNPKTPDFEWTKQNVFKSVVAIIKQLVIIIPLYLLYSEIFLTFNYTFGFWGMVLFLTIFNIISNLILRKWNLHTDDITRFFR